MSHEFDWEGDQPLQKELKDLIIYEMHVRGFTIQAPDVTPKVTQIHSPY
jgi:pullulanase/glycogen debranching enzyme